MWNIVFLQICFCFEAEAEYEALPQLKWNCNLFFNHYLQISLNNPDRHSFVLLFWRRKKSWLIFLHFYQMQSKKSITFSFFVFVLFCERTSVVFLGEICLFVFSAAKFFTFCLFWWLLESVISVSRILRVES